MVNSSHHPHPYTLRARLFFTSIVHLLRALSHSLDKDKGAATLTCNVKVAVSHKLTCEKLYPYITLHVR